MSDLTESIRNLCPNCGGLGFTVYSYNGNPEQEQCQYCYEMTYPISDKVAELEAENEKLKQQLDGVPK